MVKRVKNSTIPANAMRAEDWLEIDSKREIYNKQVELYRKNLMIGVDMRDSRNLLPEVEYEQ